MIATAPFTRLCPTVSYSTREYRYERTSENDLADGTLTLHIQRGRKVIANTYALQCERAEGGFLHTVYLAKEGSEDGEVYGVEFNVRGDSRCSCSGFARHHSCKHNDAIRDLLRKGQLDEFHPDDVDNETIRDVGAEIEAMDADFVATEIHAATESFLDREDRRNQAFRSLLVLIGQDDPAGEYAEAGWVPGSGW